MKNDQPAPKPKRTRKKAADPTASNPETNPTPTPPASGDTPLPGANPLDKKGGFTPEILDRSVISVPLMRQMQEERVLLQSQGPTSTPVVVRRYPVIIDLNLEYEGGQEEAARRVEQLVDQAMAAIRTPASPEGQGVLKAKTEMSDQYVFAQLEGTAIQELVRLDTSHDPANVAVPVNSAGRAIFRIWPDFPVRAFITKSVSTVKADAAHTSFGAWGSEIVWAVVDSGIDEQHPHFAHHKNLEITGSGSLKHCDFTVTQDPKPLEDAFGHGTHVAGIIAGQILAEDNQPIIGLSRRRNEEGKVIQEKVPIDAISGMAPRCKLVSLKVLDAQGDGEASNLIVALEYIQRINGYGRRLRIHGVNLSVGYPFEPEWFACGQSPLCVEVNRLVRSGVVVVVAAGNTGYGWFQSDALGSVSAGQDLTINDPGNAELAITVGSTHRDMPHVYGVSYFSSKGPTGDGRIKPDLVAPGEKILSCAAGKRLADLKEKYPQASIYVEDSGTSMAAPHVSGVIAAFLSVRKEFIGQPETVKQIFTDNATDLKRDRNFQGSGLVDLMRAIQAI